MNTELEVKKLRLDVDYPKSRLFSDVYVKSLYRSIVYGFFAVFFTLTLSVGAQTAINSGDMLEEDALDEIRDFSSLVGYSLAYVPILIFIWHLVWHYIYNHARQKKAEELGLDENY